MALFGLLVAGLVGTVLGSAIADSRRAEESNEVYVSYVNPEKDKIDFLDEYRILDAKLARLIGRSYGGITALINGLEYNLNYGYFDDLAEDNARYLYRHLRSVRHVRNALCHSEVRWCNLQNPSVRFTNFVRSMNRWVDETYDVRRLMMVPQRRISRY